MSEKIKKAADVAVADLWDAGSASYQLWSADFTNTSHIWPLDEAALGAADRQAQSDYTCLLNGGIEHLYGTENITAIDLGGFAYNIWCQDNVNLPNCTSIDRYAFLLFGGQPLSGPQDQNIKTLILSVPALTTWFPGTAYNTKFSTIYFRDLVSIPESAFLGVGQYLTDIYLAGSSVLSYPGGQIVESATVFHVQASLVDTYRNTEGWVQQSSTITFVAI